MELEGWLMTFDTFNKTFESNLTNSQTYTEAYELTEKSHYEITGRRRYSCYNSFRNIRQKKLFSDK